MPQRNSTPYDVTPHLLISTPPHSTPQPFHFISLPSSFHFHSFPLMPHLAMPSHLLTCYRMPTSLPHASYLMPTRAHDTLHAYLHTLFLPLMHLPHVTPFPSPSPLHTVSHLPSHHITLSLSFSPATSPHRVTLPLSHPTIPCRHTDFYHPPTHHTAPPFPSHHTATPHPAPGTTTLSLPLLVAEWVMGGWCSPLVLTVTVARSRHTSSTTQGSPGGTSNEEPSHKPTQLPGLG